MQDLQDTTQNTRWTSKFGFIMATTGAAVGLGNIFKFPYMAGEQGGGNFVIVYLVCVLLIGIPAMIGEVLIGRMGRSNPIDAMEQLSLSYHKSPYWKYVGVLGGIVLLMVLAFYSVLSGWSLAYLLMTFQGAFNHASTAAEITGLWDNLLANPTEMMLWHGLFMLMTVGVVAKGVLGGIEKLSKLLMPGLFLVLIILVLYAGITGDLKSAIEFLFHFKRDELTPALFINALGQAFFSLAIGAGCLLVYGAYLPRDTKIASTLSIVAILNTMVALLAGLAIFPIVFAYGLSPQGGPGLMYQVLPIAFSQMPYGQGVGVLFFILLLFASWTSSLSMAEPLVVMLMEKKQISRKVASLMVGILAWVLGLGTLFSFNIWQSVTIYQFTLFDILIDFPSNILLPLGGLFFVIFASVKIPKDDAIKALNMTPKHYRIWRLLASTLAPIGILVILLGGVFN